jgi:uncharacterized protein
MRWLLILLALSGSGCLGSSPASRFYTLSTIAPKEGQGDARTGPVMKVRVAPVTLPEGVDRPQLVRRTGANTVAVEEFDRWVEPLDALLRSTLVQDLGALLPEAQVLGDAVPGLATDRTVVVAVNGLELSGQVTLDAVWFVLGSGEDQPERTHRTRLRESAGAGQPGDVAPALSRIMERLSQEIAQELGPSAASR